MAAKWKNDFLAIVALGLTALGDTVETQVADVRLRGYVSDRLDACIRNNVAATDYTPKPSFTAVAAMTRIVGDAEPQGSLSRNEGKYRLYPFKKNGQDIVAAWAVKGDCEIDMPSCCATAEMRCLDLQGNATAVPHKADRLKLTEIPCYLVCRSPDGTAE